MAVLRLLGLESEPIGLPDLLAKLGSGFKERTVRRWLDLLVKEGAIKKIGQKRGTKYLALGREQALSKEVSSCFSSVSLEAIGKVKRPLFERLPIAYVETWVKGYRPNVDYYLSEKWRRELSSSGQRANLNDPVGTYAHQVYNRLIIDLSYNSSRLEGNTYSLLDTTRLVLHGNEAEGKLDEEKVMILNHKEAIRYIVDNAPTLELISNVIRTVHYLLSDGLVDPSDAGKIRRQGVRIGGSTYIPFENPKKLEDYLEIILNKACLIQNEFEQSFFLLVHLSYLQAFIDVNKRTARLAANIPLIKGNLVPLAFNDVRVDDYMSAMIAIYELQDIGPLVDLYIYSYLRTCAAYDATVKAMGFDEIRVRYRQERRNVVRKVILNRISADTLKAYVVEYSSGVIPEVAAADFIEDVLEDLRDIDESRLAGLGISPDELKLWKSSGN